MQIDFKYYLTIAQTELQANWKPLTAIAGVAIVVTAIWGKVALVGFGLICFGGYVVFGPSVKVMDFLDLKGFVLGVALIGNMFFRLISPTLLNVYAGACILAREWNFWRIHSQLTSHIEKLEIHNREMNQACDQWKKTIEALDRDFQELLGKTTGAVPVKQQLEGRSSEVANRINRDTQEIQVRLDRLTQLAKMVLANGAKEKTELAARAEQELSVLKNQHQATCTLYQENLDEFIELKKALKDSLSTRGEGQVQVQQMLGVLISLIDRLKPLAPKEGHL